MYFITLFFYNENSLLFNFEVLKNSDFYFGIIAHTLAGNPFA